MNYRKFLQKQLYTSLVLKFAACFFVQRRNKKNTELNYINNISDIFVENY